MSHKEMGIVPWIEEKEQELVDQKGYSKDWARMLVAYGFSSMGRKMGRFPPQDFLSFVFEQIEMVRKIDPERADNLDKDMLDYLDEQAEKNQ